MAYFNIRTGVRQWCRMSPFLFLLAIYFIMKNTIDGQDFGIYWQPQLQCQQTQERQQQRLADLDFADDIALLSILREDL